MASKCTRTITPIFIIIGSIIIFSLIIILSILTHNKAAPSAPPTGKVYQVGDRVGWTSGYGDYQGWAAGKEFYVGDVLAFVCHRRIDCLDSVLQVTEQDHRMCINSDPIATYGRGNDEVKLAAPGDYFFISGVYDHCRGFNQKLHVFVNPRPPRPAPPPPVSSPAPPSNSASSNERARA